MIACSPPRCTTHARTGQVRLDADARELWHHAYRKLATEPHDGIVAQITARAEAHVIRLALLYTLTDGQRQINTAHLTAALALQDYAARSAAWALTGATGDPLAEQIHATLRQHPGGLTRSQISQALNHNQPAGQIDHALHALHAAGRVTTAQIPTGGRPAQLWTATSARRAVGEAEGRSRGSVGRHPPPAPSGDSRDTARDRYARVGRIARPDHARATNTSRAPTTTHRGERSKRKRSGLKRATHNQHAPDPATPSRCRR